MNIATKILVEARDITIMEVNKMKNWIESANFFLTNFVLFLLGAYGTAFFVWIHNGIATSNATFFGVTCNLICVYLLLHFMWKRQ